MEWTLTIVIIFGVLTVLSLSRMSIAFTFLLINIFGAFFLFGQGSWQGLEALVLGIFSSVTSFSLIPIPLFLLMGEVLFRSKIAVKAIDVVDEWLGKIPGRLGVVTIGGTAILSALSGSSVATIAMMGSMMIPEMVVRGYKKPIYLGAVMSGGVDAIIPPSAMAVILAALAEMSVGKLLIAGFLPGIMMCILYAIYLVGRCTIQPDLAPAYNPNYRPFSEKILFTLQHLAPMAVIMLVVLATIFFGIATPTESAALGAFACFILAACYGKFNWQLVKQSVGNAGRVTATLFMILSGASFFSQIIAYTGVSKGMSEWVIGLGLTPIMILISMEIIIFILGIWMDGLCIIMVILPIFLPIIESSGIDMIVFGIVTLINMEVAGRTPPLGMILYVIKGVAPADCTWGDIWNASAPFVICDTLAMGIILVFPIIATFLPSLMTY